MTDTPILRAEARAKPFSRSAQNILVVDDDVILCQLTTEALSASGYTVEAAEDGAAAWEALNAHGYDLLITDNNMPKVSGVELLRKLRSVRMDLPVIMVTGAAPTAEFARRPWLVPDVLLLKPYTIPEMLRLVKKVLCEAGSATATDRSPVRTPQRILIVDEDNDLRMLYAEALSARGYEVDSAADGAAGWEALQTNRFDLLITEHDMPRLTGVELIRKLRTADMTLPVVMAAGRLPIPELAQNPSLQLAATLWKPFAIDALLNTVANALRETGNGPQTASLPGRQSQTPAKSLAVRFPTTAKVTPADRALTRALSLKGLPVASAGKPEESVRVATSAVGINDQLPDRRTPNIRSPLPGISSTG
jgi:DNA-binding response OmpR family regulator